jgi:hypothetical protein
MSCHLVLHLFCLFGEILLDNSRTVFHFQYSTPPLSSKPKSWILTQMLKFEYGSPLTDSNFKCIMFLEIVGFVHFSESGPVLMEL